MSNPYKDLPPTAYWKLAVSEKSHFDIGGLYQKRYEIARTDRLVTAGSCFAQHIARKLSVSGYNYCDYEPAPNWFPLSHKSAFNYGVYSARYCNIYTVRQLRQTLERAFGERGTSDSVWEGRNGFQDAYRPLVEPKPFESRDELEAARAAHYAAVRRVFTESDLFIFTLGLTEAWVNADNGDVYPICPGTQGGTFDASRHKFVNFEFPEIAEDLDYVVQRLRGFNANIKILLTVSPVPLTATASGQHVLPATVYSKSVLRAVAGSFYARYGFVDYFPSYEIVASHPFRAMAFDPNLRAVNPKGVNFVMGHFFEQHPAFEAISAGKVRPLLNEEDNMAEVVCEEMLLDAEVQKW